MAPRWLLVALAHLALRRVSGAAIDAAPPGRRLHVIRSVAPWQEPLGDEIEANARWFCAGLRSWACTHELWRSLPPGREEYHPWMSRFYTSLAALGTFPGNGSDAVLWLDVDALLAATGEAVGADLERWLLSARTAQPLLLPMSGTPEGQHTPKATLVANTPAGLRVLRRLSSFLPREDMPYPQPRGSGSIPHAFAYDGHTRAPQFGSLGQMALLGAYPDESQLFGTAPLESMLAALPNAQCAQGLPPGWPAAALRAGAEGARPPPFLGGPFVVHVDCLGEAPAEVARMVRLYAEHNRRIGAAEPRDDDGAAEGEAPADEARFNAVDAPLPPTPTLLLIVYGEEYARTRTPVFVKSLLSSRTTPLRLYVLGDPPGLGAFREVLDTHARAAGLLRPDDFVSMFSPDASLGMSGYPAQLHPICHTGGYVYLFYKLLAAEFLPGESHLLVVDSDAMLLGDIRALWEEFRAFERAHILSMAVDQSHRYYYRLQDPTDAVYSPGWAGVPQRTGVNGGLMMLHLARMRATRFAGHVAQSTHEGARRRAAGELESFCQLAEQDTINYVIARAPHIWRPLDCVWNYMSTNLGGHLVSVLPLAAGSDAELAPAVVYDTCPNGVSGAHGEPGDLLGCTCDRKVQLMHFVGGTRQSPRFAQFNRSLMLSSADELVAYADVRRRMPPTMHELDRLMRLRSAISTVGGGPGEERADEPAKQSADADADAHGDSAAGEAGECADEGG